MLKDKGVLFILIISCLTRLIFTIINNSDPKLSPDERFNFEVAVNVQNGLGYVYNNNNYIQTQNKIPDYRKTAFHPAYPNFTYQWLISNNISASKWVVFILSISFLLFVISIIFFVKTLELLQIKGIVFYSALIVFAFYPSNQYYIGSLFAYENIVQPLLIINFYHILKFIKAQNKLYISGINALIIILTVTLSCLFRPQAILIYFGLFFVLFLIVFFRHPKKLKGYLFFLFCLFLTISVAHIPVIHKNKLLFGKPILSTQMGFELLQGHNPFARGGWNGNWVNKEDQLYKFVRKVYPHFDSVNEYTEGVLRKKIALDFIINNPGKEISLTFRKVAIFFLPQNYEVLPTANSYNPINFMVHLVFILSCMHLILHIKNVRQEELLVLSIFVGSILLSLIFFVGYRWRYYCEPFMILFVTIYLNKLLNNFNNSKFKFENQ